MSAETQIVSTTVLQSTIEAMKSEAGALVVRDANDYASVATFLVRLRAIRKQIGYLLDPGIASATAHLNQLREQKAQYTRQIDAIDTLASLPAETWKRNERLAAEAEQRRLNDERRKAAERQAEEDRKRREKEIEAARKAGEMGKREAERLKKEAENEKQIAMANHQDVKVQAAVPTISGIRARVNWKFKIVDASKIPRVYLVPDDVLIGRMVRETKNNAEAEAKCPGIQCYSEDAI